jgi:hypothetical protein
LPLFRADESKNGPNMIEKIKEEVVEPAKFLYILEEVPENELPKNIKLEKVELNWVMWIYFAIYSFCRLFFIVIYFYLFPFLVVIYSLVFAYREFEKILDEGSPQFVTAIQGNLAQQLIALVS